MQELSTANQKQVEDNYPNNLTYKGVGTDFFEVYMELLTPTADEQMGEAECQESYLGYLPDDDVFVEGYDTWANDNEDFSPNVVFMRITDQPYKHVQVCTDEMADKYNIDTLYHNMMYGAQAMYDHLHEQVKNLIDVRLD